MTGLKSVGRFRDAAWLTLLLAVTLPAVAAAHEAGRDLADVFSRVDPAVVEIQTVSSTSVRQRGGITATSELGLGSGVLIAPDQVLTASHVVEAADRIQVRFADGTTRLARVTSSEQFADISLLKLDRVVPGVQPATLGDSDLTRTGERVFVVGAPYGMSHTLTVGYVSAMHRNDPTDAFGYADLIQTDAAINVGSSGGPLFNERGELIGIVSHIRSRSGGSEGLGFAVAINSARELVIEHRSFWPGFTGLLLPAEMAVALNVPQASGMLIQEVADGSPARLMGLRESDIPVDVGGTLLKIGGDVILAANGIRLESPQALQEIRDAIRDLPAGGRLTIEILRQGNREVIEFVSARGGEPPL
jgi:S1-C subfamily serine protease